MGPDLKSPVWMYLKACCFALIAIVCAVGLLLPDFDWRSLVLVCLLVWASARFYYFCFYVIERYIDPSFRFAGIGSVVVYLFRGSSSRADQESPRTRE
jgi:uncharacterized RDD family membrane protein YckC